MIKIYLVIKTSDKKLFSEKHYCAIKISTAGLGTGALRHMIIESLYVFGCLFGETDNELMSDKSYLVIKS